MNITELRDFLVKNVPNFKEPELLTQEGECYHYTAHWEKIQQSNQFKGARIDKNLDRTQQIKYLGEATEIDGVVFAYENLKDTLEEGFDLKIVKIHYKKAIRAIHQAEASFDKSMSLYALKSGIEMEDDVSPKTILILTSDILSFEIVDIA